MKVDILIIFLLLWSIAMTRSNVRKFISVCSSKGLNVYKGVETKQQEKEAERLHLNSTQEAEILSRWGYKPTLPTPSEGLPSARLHVPNVYQVVSNLKTHQTIVSISHPEYNSWPFSKQYDQTHLAITLQLNLLVD